MVPLATVPFEKMSKKLISSNKTNIDLSHQIALFGCIFCESFDEFVPTFFLQILEHCMLLNNLSNRDSIFGGV